MNEIRGEKVTFGKHEITELHDLPSAKAVDPIIVDAPRRRSLTRKFVSGLFAIALFLFFIAGLLTAAVESGLLDKPLTERAELALDNAVGGAYHAVVGSTSIRFNRDMRLGLRASNVTLMERTTGKPLATTESVSLAFDPLALLRGQIAVAKLDVDGVTLDPSLLPKGNAIDLSGIRVDSVPIGLEALFKQVERISDFIARSKTESVSLSDVKLNILGAGRRTVPIDIATLDFTRAPDGTLAIDGDFSIDHVPATLDLSATRNGTQMDTLEGKLGHFSITPFSMRPGIDSAHGFGIASTADLDVDARRQTDTQEAALSVKASLDRGTFRADDLVSVLEPSEVNLAYNFEGKRIVVQPSRLAISQSSFPFSGAMMDLDRVANITQQGIAFDMVFRDARSQPGDVPEPPLAFDAKVTGRFLPDSNDIIFDQLGISSTVGSLAGSLSIKLGNTSPQITFVALADRMQSSAVKQLWPFWMAKGARRWVINNIFGGTITDGRIAVALPEGRLAKLPAPLLLNEQELNIRFNIEGARMNVTGQIPPLRDTSGEFTLKGERVDVKINKGNAYFPSGRAVTLDGGDFALPHVYDKPLMAEMNIHIAGSADSVAELTTYKPIQGLQHTPFQPDDFTGNVTAEVGARFGLIADQMPPPPDWQVEMILDDVALKKKIANRNITAIGGSLRIDPEKADMKATASVDGVPLQLVLVEPIKPDSKIQRERSISGNLSDAERDKLVPGLSDVVNGPVSIVVEGLEKPEQKVSVDLTKSALSVPWIGWTKGAGIAATADFTTSSAEGATKIRSFDLYGKGFGASGDLDIDKAGLAGARFSKVKLSSSDNYALTLKRQKGGFDVSVNGSVADIRPVIAQLRSGSPGGKANANSSSASATVRAKLDMVTGFNGEALSNVDLLYSMRGTKISAARLGAVTGSGQAVVVKLAEGGQNVLDLTSGDAGALIRFADVYGKMQGGLLNMRLKADDSSTWRGTIDLRKFSLVGEERLQSIVSTPSGEDGRSLNQAVKRKLDVSTVTFDRGFAQVFASGGGFRIEKGVVRGENVGATFQGILRDARGNMDMTGTFMPAYGLNRLFAELPVIGVILGNGRDRGLLGITFKLTGRFEKPALTINPLSIIAPGVFRSIFEFQ